MKDLNYTEHHKVFLIAGSEPLGSAGIQADIKSITACGGYAAGALTCIVDEDTRGVKGIMAIPAEMVESQCRSFLADVGADCIKTGMLYSKDIIHRVAQVIADFHNIPCVVDPVMVLNRRRPSSSGRCHRMLQGRGLPRSDHHNAKPQGGGSIAWTSFE